MYVSSVGRIWKKWSEAARVGLYLRRCSKAEVDLVDEWTAIMHAKPTYLRQQMLRPRHETNLQRNTPWHLISRCVFDTHDAKLRAWRFGNHLHRGPNSYGNVNVRIHRYHRVKKAQHGQPIKYLSNQGASCTMLLMTRPSQIYTII
jgi:hypothetical protein